VATENHVMAGVLSRLANDYYIFFAKMAVRLSLALSKSDRRPNLRRARNDNETAGLHAVTVEAILFWLFKKL
jgi:hypothetical protein